MQNYNLIHNEPEDISNEDNLEGSGVLRSQFFEVTAGVPTITISELIDANIFALFRENAPYEEVDSFDEGREFTFDETTGDLVFPTDFNSGEKLFIFYYTGSAPVSYDEPVTVEEFKNYLRLLGFVDVDGSTADFDTDDTLCSELLIGAREMLERFLEISIVSKALRVTVTNLAGRQNIPLGPVNAVASFKDCNGTVLTDYVLVGGKWPEIKSPCSADLTIEYYAGYTNCPPRLKTAIMAEAAERFVNRGDEKFDGVISETARSIASTFSRKSILL